MLHSDTGEHWETRVDDLAVARSTTETGGATLVRLRLTNESDDPLVVRVVETVPEAATNTVPITTTGDDIENWRRSSDHVVHEFALPVGGMRTSAYLIRSDDEPPISIDPPSVESVEPVRDATAVDVGEVLESIEGSTAVSETRTADPARDGSGVPLGHPTARTASEPDEKDPPTRRDSGDRERSPHGTRAGSSFDEDGFGDASGSQDAPVEDGTDDGMTDASLVEDLITALEEDASPAQRRTLRSELGASESELARLEHVQSRLADLATYIDALEGFIDAHGTDVVDEMRASIDENASSVATLGDDLESVEDDLETHRVETIESHEALESELTAIWSGLSDRLEMLESELNETHSTLTTLEEEVERDRQARAREVRRFDNSISEIEESIEQLQTDVRENDAFRRRFTAAFTSGSDAVPDDIQPSTSSDDDSQTDAT